MRPSSFHYNICLLFHVGLVPPPASLSFSSTIDQTVCDKLNKKWCDLKAFSRVWSVQCGLLSVLGTMDFLQWDSKEMSPCRFVLVLIQLLMMFTLLGMLRCSWKIFCFIIKSGEFFFFLKFFLSNSEKEQELPSNVLNLLLWSAIRTLMRLKRSWEEGLTMLQRSHLELALEGCLHWLRMTAKPHYWPEWWNGLCCKEGHISIHGFLSSRAGIVGWVSSEVVEAFHLKDLENLKLNLSHPRVERRVS